MYMETIELQSILKRFYHLREIWQTINTQIDINIQHLTDIVFHSMDYPPEEIFLKFHLYQNLFEDIKHTNKVISLFKKFVSITGNLLKEFTMIKILPLTDYVLVLEKDIQQLDTETLNRQTVSIQPDHIERKFNTNLQTLYKNILDEQVNLIAIHIIKHSAHIILRISQLDENQSFAEIFDKQFKYKNDTLIKKTIKLMSSISKSRHKLAKT